MAKVAIQVEVKAKAKVFVIIVAVQIISREIVQSKVKAQVAAQQVVKVGGQVAARQVAVRQVVKVEKVAASRGIAMVVASGAIPGNIATPIPIRCLSLRA